MKSVFASVTVGLVLVLLLAGCSPEVMDAGPIEADDAGSAPPADDEEPTDDVDPDTPPDQTDEPADDETADDQTEPDPDPVDDGSDPTDDEASATSTIRLYFLADGGETPARTGPFLASVQRQIPATPRIALATLRELVDGPSAADRAMFDEISTAVPTETLVLDVSIDDRLATVDLSREFESGGGSFSMFARLAQMVYTVTQFPTVDEVQFELDGRPVTVFSGEGIVLEEPVSRDDYLDLLPTVFVDSPAAGAHIRSRVRVTGMAAVFEATFQYRLEAADGAVLAEGFAMSNNGTGWGSFDVTIGFDLSRRQEGTLTVWEYSAEDGSVQAERVTPVVLVP